MADRDHLLAVDDVHTYYGESYVLQGVSLAVPEGKVVALLGRNGMGKTTLIRSISGLTPPRRGAVLFRGQAINQFSPHQIARLGIGLVPQGRRIFGSLSVLENLILPTSSLAGHGNGAARRGKQWTMERVFEQFPQLYARRHNRGGSLWRTVESYLAGRLRSWRPRTTCGCSIWAFDRSVGIETAPVFCPAPFSRCADVALFTR